MRASVLVVSGLFSAISIFGAGGCMIRSVEAVSVARPATIADTKAGMKKYNTELAGVPVSFDLPADAVLRGPLPHSVTTEIIASEVTHFVVVAEQVYPSDRSSERAGTLIVYGILTQGGAPNGIDGFSFGNFSHERTQMMARLPAEKIIREGRTWVRSVTEIDVSPGQGRFSQVSYRGIIAENIELNLTVIVNDLATPVSRRNPAWYSGAEAMQQRILNSLHVGLPPTSGK